MTHRKRVSVVVERMYDWSTHANAYGFVPSLGFSCCWKDVRLKPRRRAYCFRRRKVSVVVERMYDWSKPKRGETLAWNRFQLLLKGCTIEACLCHSSGRNCNVSVVVERMYDWSREIAVHLYAEVCFSCCWKDVRLKHWNPKKTPQH